MVHVQVTFTFGIGADGQNGNEKCVNHLNPKPVVTLLPENVGEGVAFVGAGATHSFAVTESGRLYTWGNHDGGLGHGRDVPTLPHALDKFTQRRIQDAKILTPKVVVLPAAVRYTMYVCPLCCFCVSVPLSVCAHGLRVCVLCAVCCVCVCVCCFCVCAFVCVCSRRCVCVCVCAVCVCAMWCVCCGVCCVCVCVG